MLARSNAVCAMRAMQAAVLPRLCPSRRRGAVLTADVAAAVLGLA